MSAMRKSRWPRIALGLLSIGVGAGCRSMSGPPALLDGGLVSSPAIQPADQRVARAHAYYATGVHHELAGEYGPAFEAYRRAAELDPDSEHLVLRMASTLVLQRETETALRTVEEYLRRHPASETALLWLATFYGATGERERVLELFRRLTRQFPEQPLGWLQLAAAMARDGNREDVIRVLENGAARATPATPVLQELTRLYLAQLQEAREETPRREARRKAIATLEQIAAETPGDMDALFALGDLLIQDGRPTEAIEVYERIERLESGSSKTQQRLARAFLALEEPEQAIAILERLAGDRSGPANAAYLLGELHQQAGDREKAIRSFREATERLEGDPAPWLKLAAIKSESSDQEAAAVLLEALEKLPGEPSLIEVLALVRQQQRRFSRAADLMQQVWDIASGDESDYTPSNLFPFNFAIVLTHLRRAPEAAQWLRRAMDQEPALLDLYVQRALPAPVRYRRTTARVLRILAETPEADGAMLHAHLGAMHLAQEQPARAVREFDRALTIAREDPLQAGIQNARFFFWFGVALDQSGQTERAIEMFEACIALDPYHADALNYLAYTWALQATRLDEALRHVQTALALDPDNAAYIDTLGWIYYKQGRYEEALEQLLRADELRPDDPEILEHIQKTLEKLGR